jgi:CheY-like chemotaxis protein
LRIADTGIGIAEQDQERVFERFHRVEGAIGRTHEGSGIGLSLVQELVRLHGGTVEVRSVLGEGSTFTVSVPLGIAHLPADRIQAERTLASTSLDADTFLQEALQWAPSRSEEDDAFEPSSEPASAPGALAEPVPWGDGGRRTVLVADDNADMREYLARLLRRDYEVVAVADGVQALEAARALRPDLAIVDVMMPNLDAPGSTRDRGPDLRRQGSVRARGARLHLWRTLGCHGVPGRPRARGNARPVPPGFRDHPPARRGQRD